ncbi:MAG: InlB B-repeat-containing protein [Lachnospiraceae bacterium]
MYRRLKNILGVSLMILAIVISQVPMPEAQAEIVREMTEADMQVDDTSAHVVTFSMNGGTFRGTYNGYSFQEKTPVLVIDDGKPIDSFPDDKLASYAGYKTEPDTWYTDQECLNKYNTDSQVTKSTTLYKKWYNITSDGTTLADKGFHISPDGAILYQYDGGDKNVVIPQTVSIIAAGAFDQLDEVRAVTLPAGIQTVEKNAFSGVRDGSIIYIYDAGTEASKTYGKQLAEEYEQLVYSEYLDAEKTEQIAGIQNLIDMPKEDILKEDTSKENVPEEAPEVKEGAGNTADKPESGLEASQPEESESESKPTESESESKPTESESESQPEESSEPESSSVIVIEPDQKYTVTFDTGISGVAGEKRQVQSGRTVSELVSVDGSQPRILRKDDFTLTKEDEKKETTYTFKGWYKDNACTKEWDFANEIIEQDTTIYAKWEQSERAYFTVTYSTTEGNEKAANIPEKRKLYEDEKFEKPSKKPSMKNKTFKGWYTSKDDTKSAFKAWGKPVTEDLTLYAHFEEKSNTVVFHMNGGGYTGTYDGKTYTDAASLTKKIAVGKGISSSEYPKSSSSANFKYSNYSTDSNWYTDKECTNVYSESTVKEDLTLYKRWYYTSSGFTTNAANNVLYKYSGSVAEVTIPNSVTIIAKDAFASMGSISAITLPDKISEVRENAFSGVKNISKDITITGKTEQAKNKAKELANQYTHLVYKDSGTSKDSESSVVTTAESGSIKLGATVSGNAGTANKTGAASGTNTPAKGTIALGASGTGTTPAAGGQPSAGTQPTVSPSAAVVQPTAGTPSASQPTAPSASASQPVTTSAPQAAAVTQNKTTPVQQSSSGSSTVTKTTTKKPNVSSASAPKGTQHIKDSTPKTGDPLQYRMLIVCAMFSVGVLLILTGNGKKKKFSAS